MAVKSRQRSRYMTIGLVYIATIVSQGEFISFLIKRVQQKREVICLVFAKARVKIAGKTTQIKL